MARLPELRAQPRAPRSGQLEAPAEDNAMRTPFLLTLVPRPRGSSKSWLGTLGLLAACHHHHESREPAPDPVFLEAERNDDPLTANHFGRLRPGDHFFIDGFVRDDLADPFDGFAFTASVPLHVDFQLFIDNAVADLDVCLYDPALDEIRACFATSDNPERGGVDVFEGGLDFHLVVESFSGDARYSLEISVLPLFEALGASEFRTESLRATGAFAARASRAAGDYRVARSAERPLVEIEQRHFRDARSEIEIEIVRIAGQLR